MSKKSILYVVLLAMLISGAFVVNSAFAVDISKEKCRIMLFNGDKELVDKDFAAAKMYYRRAVQYDPWNKNAWDKYEAMVQVVSSGQEVDLSNLNITAGPASDDSDDDDDMFEMVEDEEVQFQGC